MEIQFECLDDGRWYVVFPDYEGPFEDLEMVENADKMLEALTTDRRFVSLNVSLEEPDTNDYFILHQEAHDEDGAYYSVEDCAQFNGTIWLCNVVHEFFGNHPETIYCTLLD